MLPKSGKPPGPDARSRRPNTVRAKTRRDDPSEASYHIIITIDPITTEEQTIIVRSITPSNETDTRDNPIFPSPNRWAGSCV